MPIDGFRHPVHSDDKQHHVHWLDLAVSYEELDLLCLTGRMHLSCQHGKDGNNRWDTFRHASSSVDGDRSYRWRYSTHTASTATNLLSAIGDV